MQLRRVTYIHARGKVREREAFLELNDQNVKTWKRTIESDERRKKTKTTNKIEIRLSGNEFAEESNAMRKERSKKKQQQQRTENSSTRVIYNYEKKNTSNKKKELHTHTHTTKLLGNINERASKLAVDRSHNLHVIHL